MEVGYNYPQPSNKLGLWIGPQNRRDLWPADYAKQWKDLQWKTSIRDNLYILHRHGIRVVRWFLLGNGFNYGVPPRKEVIRSPRDSTSAVFWHFDPPEKLDPLFLDHFKQLLDIHREVKMKMIPSLISFEFFATDKAEEGGGGRGEVATDWRKRNTFLFTVLGEFLRVSNAYRPWIKAWEVINEPAWDVRQITPFLRTGVAPHPPFVPQRDMNTFIQIAWHWIKDKGFASTVGHRFFSDLSEMPTGSLPQFHYYATKWPLSDPGTLPKATDAKGAFIGEFGSLIGQGYETNQTPNKASYGSPWTNELPGGQDLDPKNTLYERLKVMKDLGYELALVWPEYEDKDINEKDALKISPEKLTSIKRFFDSQ